MSDIYQLPQNVAIDPFFDFMVAGIPIWLIILVALFLVFAIGLVFWLLRWFIMRPVLGAASAGNTGSATKKQVLFFEKTRSFRIITLECIDDVLSYADLTKIPKWLITSPLCVGKVGYAPVMIASNSFDQCRDPLAELAVLKICNEYNALKPERAITNFDDFQAVAPAVEAAYPDGIDIPSFCLYRPEAIQEYTPQSRSAAMFGGMCIRDAKKLNLAVPADEGLAQYIPLILFGAVGLISIILCFLYVTGSGGS
jgi:hypothetical protein